MIPLLSSSTIHGAMSSPYEFNRTCEFSRLKSYKLFLKICSTIVSENFGSDLNRIPAANSSNNSGLTHNSPNVHLGALPLNSAGSSYK